MITKTSRRRFLKQLAIGGSFSLADLPGSLTYARRARSQTRALLPDQPDFLFLITDQERYTQHFPEGWEENNMPNLARLKKSGLSFANAFCNSSMCSPSRATLMTGLYPTQHQVMDTLPEAEGDASANDLKELDPNLPTMAALLKSAGYNVYYKGKWHLSTPQGEAWSVDDLTRYGFDGWDPPDAGEDVAPENYGGGRANHDERFVNDAVSFLQTMDTSQPFALFVSLVNPHDVAGYPKNVEQDYVPAMLQGDVQPPPTVDEDLAANGKPGAQVELLKKLAAGLGPVNTPLKRKQYVNFYGNLLKKVDEQLGRVIDALYARAAGENSLADSTLVFHFSDHGEMGLSHGGLRQKMFVAYEEAIHIPLIVSNPVLFPTLQTSDALVSLVDVMPTIATLAGAPDRQKWLFKGVDFSSIILDPNADDVQDAILFTFDDVKAGMETEQLVSPPNRLRCIREKNWKYVRYFDARGEAAPEYEMYDLVNDPQELQNLAHPSHPRYNDADIVSQRNRLAEKLARMEEELLAPLPAGIDRAGRPVLPKLELWRNYPNPFNSTTTIKFAVAEAGGVRLDIYNVAGRLVKTLVSGVISPGIHSVVWDGTDASGGSVSSGAYLIRLQSEREALTRQIILSK